MNDAVPETEDLHDDIPLLDRPLRYVRGVGPARAALLSNLGLETVSDLLWYLPKDVLDLSELSKVSELTDDKIHTVRGQVLDVETKMLLRGRNLTAAVMRAEDGLIRGVWFNQPWMRSKLNTEAYVLWAAKPKFRDGRWEMSNPRLQWLDADADDAVGEVLPKYGLTEGLKLEGLRRMIAGVLELIPGHVEDVLPERFRVHYKLPGLEESLKQLHRPDTLEQYQQARRRIVFEEQLTFQLGLALRRRVRQTTERAPAIPITPKVDARIRRLFPFELTNGQEQAIAEITADLALTQPMHRLLQADVGAGKTVVAAYAMLAAVAAGYQAILMAPTELLARQHKQTLDAALKHSRVKRGLLTGTLTAAERRGMLDDIASGKMQLVVGTQALIQKDVNFHQLGLAVIDEQHKFGVAQRSSFTGSTIAPHVLVMTATPIPRSLCLTQYGDLDLSVMKDLPPGRQSVVTSRVTTPAVANKAWSFVQEKLTGGRQAYVVCPYVDSTEADAPAGAEQTYREMQQRFPDLKVGLVHGQMDRRQQQLVMADFREGEIQMLVATSVIEVGVDVPNASLMVILDAHQFGLSQLHQLRGRIGRGSFQGYCFLFSEAENSEAQERLRALEETNNGFEIAEADFALRGPGNVLGTEQHGSLPLRSNLLTTDEKLLLETRGAAQRMVDRGTIDKDEFAPLKNAILDRYGDQLQLPRTG
ncbi:ATP-dependent DNA helicase RecG [Rubinisphaera brasiliensis]|uniref:Probable DNA 3'-5' helicase RecG n=1 Tax=Rubinisphaera brasiliensis (strain ATCC 49424 / DSM 5305 / JCM 21570 / IAM 15109 / NBRC 103401 / IFAM 1448) TaxID=756272 RepID=F0SK02_RUBBR|nr:ATP-dependent DNA helicase RecG [Rubinisphaera brasiliensis]ADY58691.1 DEAD/DEAH box helicase domain protein [Rubinisphaera brasiliensis DSM 5305]